MFLQSHFALKVKCRLRSKTELAGTTNILRYENQYHEWSHSAKDLSDPARKSTHFGWKTTCESHKSKLSFKTSIETACTTASKTKSWSRATLTLTSWSTSKVKEVEQTSFCKFYPNLSLEECFRGLSLLWKCSAFLGLKLNLQPSQRSVGMKMSSMTRLTLPYLFLILQEIVHILAKKLHAYLMKESLLSKVHWNTV